MKDITKVFRKIITDLFEVERISDEELLVAITHVLNLYDFYMSENCPLTYKKVELTREASMRIVSVFVNIPPEEKKTSSRYGWWLWRWHEFMAKHYDDRKFLELVESVAERFSEHDWIDYLE